MIQIRSIVYRIVSIRLSAARGSVSNGEHNQCEPSLLRPHSIALEELLTDWCCEPFTITAGFRVISVGEPRNQNARSAAGGGVMRLLGLDHDRLIQYGSPAAMNSIGTSVTKVFSHSAHSRIPLSSDIT